jgi:nitrate reductase NapE component
MAGTTGADAKQKKITAKREKSKSLLCLALPFFPLLSFFFF